jgi:hypothetical protein
MTLTVQDLVTKLDDFADDAKVTVKRFNPHKTTSVIRNVIDIRKDDDGSVILMVQLPLIQHNDHEESEDEESEDKELKILGYPSKGFEDEESQDEESEKE